MPNLTNGSELVFSENLTLKDANGGNLTYANSSDIILSGSGKELALKSANSGNLTEGSPYIGGLMYLDDITRIQLLAAMEKARWEHPLPLGKVKILFMDQGSWHENLTHKFRHTLLINNDLLLSPLWNSSLVVSSAAILKDSVVGVVRTRNGTARICYIIAAGSSGAAIFIAGTALLTHSSSTPLGWGLTAVGKIFRDIADKSAEAARVADDQEQIFEENEIGPRVSKRARLFRLWQRIRRKESDSSDSSQLELIAAEDADLPLLLNTAKDIVLF